MIKFYIPYPADKKAKSAWNREYGLNAIYAGKHWTRRKRDAEYWHELVLYHLRQQKIPFEICAEPVSVSYYFNDNKDLSNEAYIAKLIEDAIKGILITDDSRKYVKEIHYYCHDEDCIGVIIRPVNTRSERAE